MPTDIKLNQLIINQLTQEQYDEAKAAGTLSDTELYITDSDDDPQVKSNLSQTIDDSTTKYPSNKAVKDESSRITTLMDNYVKKSGDTMDGLLDTKGYFRTRGRVTRIVEVNSLDNSQTWGTFEVYKDSDTAAHTAIFAFNPSDNSKSAIASIYINGDEIWAQCPASKRQNSIVTSEYMGSNYVRFGNGIQICFGNVITNNNTQTVTYGQPFKESNPNLTLSLIDGGPGDPRYWQAFKISEEKNTGFKITGPTEISRFGWIAIGYWY